MITFSWFCVDVSFVWPSGFVANHRVFHEMATSLERAKEKTLEYLAKVGATGVVVHSVTPESEPVAPLPKSMSVVKPDSSGSEGSVPKVRALF